MQQKTSKQAGRGFTRPNTTRLAAAARFHARAEIGPIDRGKTRRGEAKSECMCSPQQHVPGSSTKPDAY